MEALFTESGDCFLGLLNVSLLAWLSACLLRMKTQ